MLRRLDDTVDELYSAIKFYLTQISGEALSESQARRWTDIVSFTINMEQVGDIIERIVTDLEDKKIDKRSGVSQRLPISCMENVISNAERRAILGRNAARLLKSTSAIVAPSVKIRLDTRLGRMVADPNSTSR